MDKAALQLALRAWVLSPKASNLAANKVIWSEQGNVALDEPYLTMRLGDLTPLGACDEESHTYDEDADPEEEITLAITGRRVLPVTLQAFGVDSDVLLSRVQTALGLPSLSEALNDAGLSAFDLGKVQNTTALFETEFEPRALLEVLFYVGESVSETTTFVETVAVTNEIPTPDTTFTVGE